LPQRHDRRKDQQAICATALAGQCDHAFSAGGSARNPDRVPQTKGRQRDATALKIIPSSFRDDPKDQTRNLEIPGSSLRAAAPE
jgi:hypothetical protein